MADVVQYRLERMWEEFDELHARGLFSKAEIAEIVRRRRDFEYRLKRPSPLKSDFIDYIQYEIKLDSLRLLRKKAMLGGGDDDVGMREKGERKRRKDKKKLVDDDRKSAVSDLAGMMRVMNLYRLATRRFKGDLQLWFQYLDYCRGKKNGRMKKVLAEAIKYHPKVPALWIYAAAWEFDQNLNVAAAREVMQSGLRSNPKSEDLWIEYLRMELTYLNKLKARKSALKDKVKPKKCDDAEGESWKEENKDLFMPLDELGEQGNSDLIADDEEKKEDLFWRQGYLILQTIYHGAVEALPSSLNLRKNFLSVLDSVDVAHSDDLKREIMNDLKKDFSHDEDFWDWFSRLQMKHAVDDNNLSKENVQTMLNRVVQAYEEALGVLPTEKMFSLYAKFWSDVVFPAEQGIIPTLQGAYTDASEFSSSILKVFERAEQCGCLSEDLACQYVSFYSQIGKFEEARNLAKRLCEGPLSHASQLWVLRICLEMKWHEDTSFLSRKDDIAKMFKLLEQGASRLAVPESESFWRMAMKWCSDDKGLFKKLMKSATLAIAKVPGDNCGASIAQFIVEWSLQRNGVQHARETYRRFLALPRPSLKLYLFCIELEQNIAALGDDDDALANCRKLYESALGIYSQNLDLWRNYYHMEQKLGTSETATTVYWRARKELKDLDPSCLSYLQ